MQLNRFFVIGVNFKKTVRRIFIYLIVLASVLCLKQLFRYSSVKQILWDIKEKECMNYNWLLFSFFVYFARSVGALEYTDCISAEG